MQWSLKIMCWLLPRAWRLGSQSKPHLLLIFFPCVKSSSTILQGEATTWFGISSLRLVFHFSEEESIALLETGPGLPSPVCLPPSGLIVKYLGTQSSGICDHLCSGNTLKMLFIKWPPWCRQRGRKAIYQCPGYQSWDGVVGVAAGFKRRGGAGLFSQPVNISQVSRLLLDTKTLIVATGVSEALLDYLAQVLLGNTYVFLCCIPGLW